MSGEVRDLRSRLEAIAEELADIALDRLREATSSGAGKAPADERVITRARRSVEKAAALLGQLDSG